MAKKAREPKESVSVRIEADVRKAIEREAERDRRPVANLIGNILRDWCDERRAHDAV